MSYSLDDCRIYVCKSSFGESSECLFFKTMKEYNKWYKIHKEVYDRYSFQILEKRINHMYI